ncbi:hypothetical protein Avbf_05779, partial [Armadillidium vulgare]
MNARGNYYSRNHTTLDPVADKEEFWAFTYDEIGTYDDPAAIDYALSVTGQDQIYYVGFSMGTTVFFIMMSERPEYVDKIRAASLLAPVVYLNNVKGVLKPLANISGSIDELYPVILAHEPGGSSFHTVNHYAQQILSVWF